ncbi:hypothetical protein A1O1_03844 [Capronia coronata CBS 617.96]|uniref:Transcription factor domain-containing protein n=1 Tax=Capronia coronata CBS 617.96 TaxID=1182541 RepID=W9YM34_9EURO|nr:uncharacterized protein A1O1_03844 [Capronia coronata CBS 617.96]EXJ90740.1 hypothetical protein A1O1_03844 [Capronia coronata CBS 617.96]
MLTGQDVKNQVSIASKGYRFVDDVVGGADPNSTNGQHLLTPQPGEASIIDPRGPDTRHRAGNSADPIRTFGQILLDTLHVENPSPTRWPAFEELTEQQYLIILDHYKWRLMQAVPFALLPPDIQPGDKNPILLLSILLTASSSFRDFQYQADEVFRHVLADQVIIKGQRSLDLLQGLLTYLTWYHHHFDPETQQFYQLLQLATAMAADLGLPKKFAGDDNNALQTPPIQTVEDPIRNELRAFLLCYYLNCGAAVLGYDRPENMHCIRSLRQAAQLLAQSPTEPHDVESPALVELLYVAAQHRVSINNLENSEIPISQMQVCWDSETALKSWAEKYLHEGTPCVLRSSYNYISTYRILKPANIGVGGRLTPASLEDIATCIAICQAQLSNISQQDPSYLVEFSVLEWAPVMTYLFILPRLEAAIGSTTTTASAASAASGVTPSADRYGSHNRTSCALKMVEQFRSQLAKLKAHAETDTMLNAHRFFAVLDQILPAVERRAIPMALQNGAPSLQISQSTAVDGGGSAYELVNSYTDDDDYQPRERTASLDRVWVDFMSDWVQW